MRDLFNGVIKALFAASFIAGLWMMTFEWKFWVVTAASFVMFFVISSVTSIYWNQGAVSAEKSQKPDAKNRP